MDSVLAGSGLVMPGSLESETDESPGLLIRSDDVGRAEVDTR